MQPMSRVDEISRLRIDVKNGGISLEMTPLLRFSHPQVIGDVIATGIPRISGGRGENPIHHVTPTTWKSILHVLRAFVYRVHVKIIPVRKYGRTGLTCECTLARISHQ